MRWAETHMMAINTRQQPSFIPLTVGIASIAAASSVNWQGKMSQFTRSPFMTFRYLHDSTGPRLYLTFRSSGTPLATCRRKRTASYNCTCVAAAAPARLVEYVVVLFPSELRGDPRLFEEVRLHVGALHAARRGKLQCEEFSETGGVVVPAEKSEVPSCHGIL